MAIPNSNSGAPIAGRSAVVDGRLRHGEVHVGGQHVDAGVAAQEQWSGELPEPEQQRHAAAVDDHRPQQRQDHPEEHAELRGAAHLGGLDELGVDVLEAGADEQVDESSQAEAGDDDDPRQGVDVDRAFLQVVPPRQCAEERVEVSRSGRQQERPAEHAGDRGHDDRQDREHPQHPQSGRQAGRGPRQQRAEHQRDDQRTEREEDRRAQRLRHRRSREGVAIAAGTILEGQCLQPPQRHDDEVGEPGEEGQEPDPDEDPSALGHPDRTWEGGNGCDGHDAQAPIAAGASTGTWPAMREPAPSK